jgi:hypothetical protein
MLFKTIREKIAQKRLKNVQITSRHVSLTSFEQARSVLVLFNATNIADFEYINEFIKELNHKKIFFQAVGFSDANLVPEVFQMRASTYVFSRKEQTYFFLPPQEICDKIAQQAFDIVVNLDLNRSFPLYYLSAIARCNFKIGCGKDFESCFDLMLSLDSDASVSYFIDQLKKYLNILKNAS